MRLSFKHYIRRDGTQMFYINNDRGVSLGVSPDRGIPPVTKRTKGEQKLLDAAMCAVRDQGQPFTGDMVAHDGESCRCGPYTLAITDVATLGGMQVNSDGAYILRDGKYVMCGEWFEVVA